MALQEEVCERQAELPGALLKMSSYNYTYNNFFLILFLYSQSLTCTRCIAFKQWCISHTNTNTLAMIPTYGRILSAIEKALRELVEEYQGVGRSLWDLVAGQERNTAQLERIRATIEWK